MFGVPLKTNVSPTIPETEVPDAPVLVFLTETEPPPPELIFTVTPMYSKYAVRFTSPVIVKFLLALVLSSDHLVNL